MEYQSSLSSKVIEWIHNVQYEDISFEALHEAKRALLDTVGIGIAGQLTQVSTIAHNFVLSQYGSSDYHHSAKLWCSNNKSVSMCGAALANAWIIDSIDMHDTGHYTKGHAGCALIPSLLSCIHIYEKNNENKKLNGKEFLTTLIVGYEIAYRAGHSLHVTVPDIHSSGSWVSLGCSAMLCRLLKLSYDSTAHALGIAEYYGPRSQIMRCVNYPTMLKDGLGQGALVGISSALLGELGFTGSPAVTMTKVDDNKVLFDIWNSLGKEYRINIVHVYKCHACCYWAQPSLNAIDKIKQKYPNVTFMNDTISNIDIYTFFEATHLLQTVPKTSDQAQYSISFSTAAALIYGRIGPKLLNAINDQKIINLMEKIHIHIDPQLDPTFMLGVRNQISTTDNKNISAMTSNASTIIITLRDGSQYDSGLSFVKWDKIAGEKEPSDEELIEKYMWLCKEAGVEDQQAIEQLKDICMQDIENIEDMNILQDILADLHCSNSYKDQTT
ncbi:unnamed protein product [Rotaria sordida]|uniref:Uncharacterized protein n=1 Tax=Rotaria sordida TaxID=392033 RepID=A0A815TJW1_9BILA|nr:unnamed protein product [Rotaria sordida]